jgi:uncharacterized Tic20 family protein
MQEKAVENNTFRDSGSVVFDSGPSKSERQWATGCHLIPLAGYLLLIASVLAPLVMWLLKREDGAFIDGQGKESVNFQISILIYFLVGLLLVPVLGLGVFIIVALSVFDLVCMVIGAIKASEGTAYRYPLCIRFIK